MINIEKIEFFPNNSSNPCNLCNVGIIVNGIKLNFSRLYYVKGRGFIFTFPVRENRSLGEKRKYFQLSDEDEFERVRLAVIKRYLLCRTIPNWKLAVADADITAEDIAFFSRASAYKITKPDGLEKQRNSVNTTTTP